MWCRFLVWFWGGVKRLAPPKHVKTNLSLVVVVFDMAQVCDGGPMSGPIKQKLYSFSFTRFCFLDFEFG